MSRERVATGLPTEHGRARPFLALVVEDDAVFRATLAQLVAREGFEVLEASSLAEARRLLEERAPDVVCLDPGLPDGSGFELMELERKRQLDFVVITGNTTHQLAVEALRQGAADFLTKPVDRVRLHAILSHLVRMHVMRDRVTSLSENLIRLGRFGPMVGRSPAMNRVYELIAKIAPARGAVLITGETGTGKELVAETIHQMSPRAGQRFVAVNCGAIAPNVIESELFGHERGSFTGADQARKGYFESASGGTLLLDEITEMSAALQVRLLRVIETGRLFRVGASDPISVDVRLIAATNRDPEQAVAEGRLREDLYWRLNMFQIDVPPLRERGDDVVMLAEHFLSEFCARERLERRWSEPALRRLRDYAWPGNVRELRNVVERAALVSGDVILDAGLPGAASEQLPMLDGSQILLPVGTRLDEVERNMILATLRMVRGDKRQAAWRLGISLKTLYTRLGVYQAAGRLKLAGRIEAGGRSGVEVSWDLAEPEKRGE